MRKIFEKPKLTNQTIRRKFQLNSCTALKSSGDFTKGRQYTKGTLHLKVMKSEKGYDMGKSTGY